MSETNWAINSVNILFNNQRYKSKVIAGQDQRKPMEYVPLLRVTQCPFSLKRFHMLISIPPKYAVSNVVGYIKGKSAIHIARNYLGRRKNFTGQQFWARGYHVSTVGRDENAVREYIKAQEKEDRRLDQLNLFK